MGKFSQLAFYRSPFLGILVVSLLTLSSAFCGYIDDSMIALRGALTIAIALCVTLLAYVPFIALLVGIANGRYMHRVIPLAYLLYLLAALQLAHTCIFFAIYTLDDESFYGVCDDCGGPVGVMTRLFYYAGITFSSVGYGDIGAVSIVASLSVLPVL